MVDTAAHDMLQNHPIGIEGVSVQNESRQDGGDLLRVAASSNWAVKTDRLRHRLTSTLGLIVSLRQD